MKSFYQKFNLWIPSPVQKVNFDFNDDIHLFIKRDDLIHNVISGNKFRKLKYILSDFFQSDKSSLIAFGGQYSNLLHALSIITNELNINAHFYIMSYGKEVSNPTIDFIKKNNVDISFLSKSEFRKIRDNDFLIHLQNQFPDAYIIPEGASNYLATLGSSEIIDELTMQFDQFPDYIVMDIGTGGTFTGVLSKLPQNTKLIGIPVLKGVDWDMTLKNILGEDKFLNVNTNYEIIEKYHFGGFAKAEFK
ncbi:MAG: pyridoxal-phosphate dependent enzyme [Saprospiraceae bacterium]